MQRMRWYRQNDNDTVSEFVFCVENCLDKRDKDRSLNKKIFY